VTPVLWLHGPPCVGKSTVGYQIFTTVWGSGTKAAYVDLAQIGFHGEGVDHRLRAANLAAMWPGFLAAGALCVVLTGQAERADLVAGYVGDCAAPG
jgi:adenylylsulfate kinase-like enzyme